MGFECKKMKKIYWANFFNPFWKLRGLAAIFALFWTWKFHVNWFKSNIWLQKWLNEVYCYSREWNSAIWLVVHWPTFVYIKPINNCHNKRRIQRNRVRERKRFTITTTSKLELLIFQSICQQRMTTFFRISQVVCFREIVLCLHWNVTNQSFTTVPSR